MILNHPQQTAEKSGFSCRNALSCRMMPFPAAIMHFPVADCVNSSPPLIPEISGIRSGNFRKTQGNSVEFCMALNMNSVGIPGEFWGDAGFSGKFGVWSGFGRFGASKGFCANSHFPAEKCGFRGSCGSKTPQVTGLKNQERKPTFTRTEAQPFPDILP